MPRISADDRRETFLRAAITVLSQEGISNASSRRIATEAGLSQASLYYCYRGTDELFFGVLEAGTTRFRELLATIEQGQGLPTTTERLMHEIFDWFVQEPDLFGALFELIVWAWHLPDDRKSAQEVYDTYIGLAAGVLRRGLPDGDPADVDPLARYVIAALDGVYLQFVTYRDLERARETYESFVVSAVSLASSIAPDSRRRRRISAARTA